MQQLTGVDDGRPMGAQVRPRDIDDGVDAEVVGPDGRARVRLEGYRTIELPGGLDPQVLEPIQSAIR